MSSQIRAEKPTSSRIDGHSTKSQSTIADWSAYASAYDLLSEHNPEYQSLIEGFSNFLSTIEAPRVIYDIGGGTGNYTQAAARAFPGSEIHLVEPDTAMIKSAQAKLSPYANISFENVALENFQAPGRADLVVCVHALYAMPGQEDRLRDLHTLLRPGGTLYLIDLGRHMNVSDWRRYLFSEIKKQHGLFGAIRIFWQGRQVAKQNKAILKAQQDGTYWLHDGQAFASAVTSAGFNIIRQESVYRDHSDLVVCTAMPLATEAKKP